MTPQKGVDGRFGVVAHHHDRTSDLGAGLQGVMPEHADQAVRYLAEYLTKVIGETHTDGADPAYQRHLDRLHAELRWLPTRRGARTGSATACNPTTPSLASSPGSAGCGPTIGTT